ncbi:unnamed protein product [Caenorhabditis sp. 36 PRJEB53466]|nr:unnamed protein product [Caenorhabditis sp. 36 PRJEB53466]
MSWLRNRKKAELSSGSYPGGRKSFSWTFSLKTLKIDEDKVSEEHSSGNFYWNISVRKKLVEEVEQLDVFLSCSLDKRFKLEKGGVWRVDYAHVLRFKNHENPASPLVLCNHAFSSTAKSHSTDTINISEIPNEFKIDGDIITIEAEIGVKRVDWKRPLTDFTVKRKGTDLILMVGIHEFYVKKKILAIVSPVFQVLLDGLGDPSDNKEIKIPINNVDFEPFHIFLHCIHGKPIEIRFELVESLLKLAVRFETPKLATECEEFLMKSVADDAEVIRLADTFQLQTVVMKKLESLNTIPALKAAFKSYRTLSDPTMTKLVTKILEIE